MAVVLKPINEAFVLKSDRVDEFFGKKGPTSKDLIQKFELNRKSDKTSKRGVK